MLHTLDLVLIGVYLLAMIVVGIACRGRQQDANDYFTAGGGLGGWFGSLLVGLSIAATLFSGISFVAYPSVVYGSGLRILAGLLCFPLAWIVLHYWFLPRYLSRGYRHPYDVIERRFGRTVRLTAAVMFVLLRVGWMAALIYAPTLALMSAGRLSDAWFWPLVLAIGLSSTVYTTLGGIRGVIVTDAIQFILIIVGILAAVTVVLLRLPVPYAQAWAELGAAGKLTWFDPTADLVTPLTFWSVALGASVSNLGSYLGDQMALQRYLASGDRRSASRSFAINIVGAVFVTVLLAVVGLMLWAWYRFSHDPNLPASPDSIFPYFVATQLPVGVVGLVLAAILGATMSSITSGINALSAAIMLDLRRPRGGAQASRELRLARLWSLVIGLTATLAAGLVALLGKTLFDTAQSLLGVFLGPLLACVLLAVAGVRLRPAAMLCGLIAGALAGWAVAVAPLLGWPIYSLWVAPIAFATVFVVSGVVNLIGRFAGLANLPDASDPATASN